LTHNALLSEAPECFRLEKTRSSGDRPFSSRFFLVDGQGKFFPMPSQMNPGRFDAVFIHARFSAPQP